MKLSYLLYSLLAGLTVYSLLVFTGGDRGLTAMALAESYRNLLNSNLDSIREINRELTVDFDALSSDKEMIKLRARALGYFESGEHLVHIDNWSPGNDQYNPGIVIKKEYRMDVDEKQFRLLSTAGSLLLLILLLLYSMAAGKKNRPAIR